MASNQGETIHTETAEWVSCPECGSSDVTVELSIIAGADDTITFSCDDCQTTSQDSSQFTTPEDVGVEGVDG